MVVKVYKCKKSGKIMKKRWLSILFILVILIVNFISSEELFFDNGIENRQGIGEIDLRENVLVIYNKNYVHGKELAEYYANKRGIDNSHLCEVTLPNGNFATKEHLLGARKTIYDGCLCKLTEIYETCSEDNRKEVIRDSLITHFVLIKGIPHRLTGIGNSRDSEEPSFDYYLSLIDIDNMISTIFPANRNIMYYGHSRAIDPYEDDIFSYGRIEEMNAERTKELIDKIILSEQRGVSGNFVLIENSYFRSSFFKELSSSYKDVCKEHYEGGEGDYENCRLGISKLHVPGEPLSEIKKVINAGIYLGNGYKSNSHNAFDGFYNMLNWHKSEYDCITLCEDFENPIDEENCRINSGDYFKEINTDCVGANNLIGWQLRSYPVQYFGFWPTGWYPVKQGSSEKTPPLVLEGDAFTNERFSDNKYLRFGSLDNEIVENPECILENGDIENCNEIVAVNLEKRYVYLNENIAPGEKRSFTIKFRHKNPEYNNGKIYVRLLAWYEDKTYERYEPVLGDIVISEASDNWMEKEIKIEVENNKEIDINRIWLRISSHKKSNIKKWFEIDGVEIIDDFDGTEYLGVDTGSFNNKFIGQTRSGDYAPNAIARLGAIGWWGSGSHYYTGGFAFSSTHNFIGSFYSGKSLGESLLFSGSTMSGTIYADPLYRPSGVKIYMGNGTKEISRPNKYYFSKNLNFPNDDIYINAFHGLDGESEWSLSYCIGDNITFCDENNKWTGVEFGDGLAYNKKINTNLNDIHFENENLTIILKLRVWRDGEEDNDLIDYAYFNHIKDVECPERYCLEFNGKIDGFGKCLYDTKGSCSCKNHSDCGEDGFCYFNEIKSDNTGFCESFNTKWTKNITNCKELQLIDKNLSEDYQLMNNINCFESRDWVNGSGFMPIGLNNKPFSGSLNGNGFFIENLFINKKSYSAGLFSSGYSFEIKNLNIIGAYIKGRFVGGFVGIVSDSTKISNCSFTGEIDSFSNTGGLIGVSFGEVNINKCSVELELENQINNVGGFIGGVANVVSIVSNISIENSISKVTGEGSINTGGFIGQGDDNSKILINNSYSIVDFQETSYSGGIIGIGKAKLENVFSISNISKSTESGNLIGKAYEGTEIINSHYYDVTDSNSCIGENSNTENIDCNKVLDIDYFYEKTNEPLSKWDFENTWNFSIENFPTLIKLINPPKCGDRNCDLDKGESCLICPEDCDLCLQTSCSGCENCDGWFDSCSYEECHKFCQINEICYYKGNLFGENCVNLNDVCNIEILSCEDYSEEECFNDLCNVAVSPNGCELKGRDCQDAPYCGDGNCDSEEDCSLCSEDCGGCVSDGGGSGSRGSGSKRSKSKSSSKIEEQLNQTYSENLTVIGPESFDLTEKGAEQVVDITPYSIGIMIVGATLIVFSILRRLKNKKR